jgi:hypothetical protein
MQSRIEIGSVPEGEVRVCSWSGSGSNPDIMVNSQSYACHDVGPLELELLIYRDTEEGGELGRMLRDGSSTTDIDDYLFTVAVKHMTADDLKETISNALEDSYRKGQKAKAKEIRKALGLK